MVIEISRELLNQVAFALFHASESDEADNLSIFIFNLLTLYPDDEVFILSNKEV